MRELSSLAASHVTLIYLTGLIISFVVIVFGMLSFFFVGSIIHFCAITSTTAGTSISLYLYDFAGCEAGVFWFSTAIFIQLFSWQTQKNKLIKRGLPVLL